ncbi:MAG TPA: ABC transporter ATP-binding protein [Planctomycetota bacterium]|nr:ABC transporter ATP-binding protein [Planctomycetota bacterium]
MTSPAIAVRELRYRYGRTQALDGATLEVPAGALHALLGRNGAGKSTLIGCLTGLLRARDGSVHILGRPVPREAAAALAEVGVAFEVGAFYGELSGRANARAFARLKGLAAAEADAALERLGIAGPAAERPVSTYSMGMRQRLSLARALLGRPRLVILDEPFNALDPDGVVEVRRLIRERRDRDGTAFLVSSHNLLEMERLAERVSILREGRVVRDGPLEALIRGAGGHYRLEVGDPARARALVTEAAVPFAGAGNALEVRIAREAVPDLVRRLAAEGVAIYEVREVVPTLEDVFRELAGPRAAAPPGREEAAA